MTEIGEGLAILLAQLAKEEPCDHKPADRSWKCNLEGDSAALRKNIEKHCGVPEPKQVDSIDDVGYTSWPSQAHHLIPWQQLKKHPITMWLAEKPPVGGPKLFEDAAYDVDHGRNGKFMPYASRLREWKKASASERRKLAKRVMGAAGMQLHQGPHSFRRYGTGEAGYKTRVKEYLDRLRNAAMSHYAPIDPDLACKDCTSKEQNGKYPARQNTVRQMDRVSELLEVDLVLGRIFVSRRAADHALSGGVMR